MAKSKGSRIVITLECKSAAGVYRYTTTKNRRNNPDRLEIKKYCPLTKRHEIFKEIK
jgi:large subunit ribosomal protein L33